MMRGGWIAAFVTAASVGVFAPPAAAASAPNSCKMLKTTELEKAFNATVTGPRKGLKTAISTACDYQISASGSRPAGVLTVSVMFVNGKSAYDGLKREAGYEAVPELGKALYQPATGALAVLKGDNYVTVQGVFFTETLPLTQVDAKAELIPLAQIATRRV